MEPLGLNITYLLVTAFVLLLYLGLPVLILVAGLLIYHRITRKDRLAQLASSSLDDTNRKLDQLISLQEQTLRLLQTRDSSGQ